jgi:hypothetical protein
MLKLMENGYMKGEKNISKYRDIRRQYRKENNQNGLSR